MFNEFGQPIGSPLPNWSPPPRPSRVTLAGRFCRLEPLDLERHAAALFAAIEPLGASFWTYLPYGPFQGFEEYRAWLKDFCLGDDPLFFTIVDLRQDWPVGMMSYMRIAPEHGAMEVGHVLYGAPLQKTPAGTEAMYLFMRNAFELGYRRYEWKCDALNAPSRAAAERLGFRFEGIFRQAIVYKNRTRDTAWFSVINSEWPALKRAFERWLSPENFDSNGRQRSRLGQWTQ